MNKSDRCDQCGAEALARVTKPVIPATVEEALAHVMETSRSELELMFCGHHMNKHAEALTDAGFVVVARREIETEPEPA